MKKYPLLLSLFSFLVMDCASALIVKRGTIWKANRPGEAARINVLLPSGTTEEKDLIAKFAGQWSQFANVDLNFYRSTEEVPSGERVHIKVDLERPEGEVASGSSYLGTQARGRTLKLRIGTKSTTHQFHGVVIHEFGHALGLQHEHQHAERTFTYNEEALLAHCREANRVSFCRDQQLETFGSGKNELFPYDPESIMHYPVSTAFAFNVPEEARISNSTLSLLDKLSIAEVYPGRLTREEIESQHQAEREKNLRTHSVGNCEVYDFMSPTPENQNFRVFMYRNRNTRATGAHYAPSRVEALINMKHDPICR